MTSSRSEQRTPHTKAMYTRSNKRDDTSDARTGETDTTWTLPDTDNQETTEGELHVKRKERQIQAETSQLNVTPVRHSSREAAEDRNGPAPMNQRRPRDVNGRTPATNSTRKRINGSQQSLAGRPFNKA